MTIRKPKPLAPKTLFAHALIARPQHLRATERVTSTTFALHYAAKWRVRHVA